MLLGVSPYITLLKNPLPSGMGSVKIYWQRKVKDGIFLTKISRDFGRGGVVKLSVIFEEKPKRWGFRGDPYFWDYLKNLAEDMDMISPDELENWIKGEYFSLSGKRLTGEYMDFAVVEQFAHGGMSSGGVSNEWWVETGIPLLKSRLSAV